MPFSLQKFLAKTSRDAVADAAGPAAEAPGADKTQGADKSASRDASSRDASSLDASTFDAAIRTPEPIDPERHQVGALPWRIGQQGLEILLVSSRDTKRWIIPKGWPMAGRKDSAAAGIEALEEAGLLGAIDDEPIGHFHYQKRLFRRVDRCRVTVYAMRVTRQRAHWPEKHERRTSWFPAEKAMAQASDPELAQLIGIFAKNRSF